MRKTLFLLMVLIILANVHLVKAEPVLLPSTVYSKAKLQIFSEQDGELVQILNVGDTFNKGDVVALIEGSLEREQLTLLDKQERNMRTKISEYQRIIDGYESLIKSNSVSKEQRAHRYIDLLDARYELILIEREIARLQYILSKKEVRAPFDGVVLARNLKLRELAIAGNPLITILDPSSLHVLAYIPRDLVNSLNFQEARAIEDNTKIEITFDYILPSIDPRSNTIEASFHIISNDVMLGQGLKIEIPKKLK